MKKICNGFDRMLSVIIPAYNVAQYIDKCIESVMKQTYQNIEIIIVDDGSTDETGTIIDKYASPCIHVFHQANLGVTAARLRGVKFARGSWIGFVDGDDTVEPNMYEHLLYNAEKADAQISHCGYFIQNDSSEVCVHNTGKKYIHNREQGIEALLEGDLFEPSLCNKIYRQSLFESIDDEKILNENCRNMEDLLLNYYLFRAAEQSVFEDICLYHYIKRDGTASTSRATPKMWNDILHVFDILLTECDGTNESIIKTRIVASLTKMAYHEYIEKQIIINARARLIDFLSKNRGIGIRTRVLGLLSAYVPYLYWLLYKVYKKS